QAEAQRGEDRKADNGRMGERITDGCTHQRSGAGRSHHHRQNAGEEAARVAMFLRERSACAGERKANFKLAGERQPEEEEQQGHDGEKDGGLELKSPPELFAGGAQDEQDRDDSPEGNENSESVDPAVGAELAALLLRRLHERQALDEEDGE